MDEKINFVFDIWEAFGICTATCNCTVVRPNKPDIVSETLVVVVEGKD